MSAAAPATEIVFLPGFDGVGELRAEFVQALARHHPARSVSYPDRTLDSLAGYARYAASQVHTDSRPVLVAESFSGLVAARWAARDPHVAAVVLCGAFARAPVPWASLGASMPAVAQFLGAHFLNPLGFAVTDPARKRWSEALATALRAMRQDVIGERLRIIATEDVSAELRGLRIPVVIVQFDDDFVVGGAARGHLEEVCQNAEVVRVPGAHFAIETRPRESAAAIAPRLAALFTKPLRRTGT